MDFPIAYCMVDGSKRKPDKEVPDPVDPVAIIYIFRIMEFISSYTATRPATPTTSLDAISLAILSDLDCLVGILASAK